MATNKVSLGDDLQRRQWVKDNLLKNSHISFFAPYTGATSDSVIYQEIDTSCSTGHTIVFDYSGKLTGKMYKGEKYDDAELEQKRKFEDKITVEEFSLFVDNGSKFDACDVDDLMNEQHSTSITMLADLFRRHKDQAIFDTLQGVYNKPTHILDLGNTITLDTITDLGKIAKTGQGLVKPDAQGKPSSTKAVKRSPLDAFKSMDGRDYNLVILDIYTATKLKKDTDFKSIVSMADVRGRDNIALKGVLGTLGNVVFVEAPVFFGSSPSGAFDIGDTEIQEAGLRRYAVDSDGKVYWEGQAKFDSIEADIDGGDNTKSIYSRNLLLGGGACQIAFGRLPDYKLEFSKWGKTSGSMLEFWGNFKKTKLKVAVGKDFNGKVADIDYGVITIDIKIK